MEFKQRFDNVIDQDDRGNNAECKVCNHLLKERMQRLHFMTCKCAKESCPRRHHGESSTSKNIQSQSYQEVSVLVGTVESRTLQEETYSPRQGSATHLRWKVRSCNQSTVQDSPSISQHRTVLTVTSANFGDGYLWSCLSPRLKQLPAALMQ